MELEVCPGMKITPIASENPTPGKASVHELVIDHPNRTTPPLVLKGTGDALLKMLSASENTVREMIAFEVAAKALKNSRVTS
ncbi:hypothetical protein BcepF1.027 [Burkholderia phage BcepF1]|uniref:Uncharacterized protein n=1 Tax=Burkholderia phage BcepF1 TaxID=2886897 RepID=A1YZT1_9CAUD|nr:hypothetical protein BcepF1.027 [Burkholderia phage BcepF1]ABL96758.1 hypothetical protein BcepF1.027 [Burkholderia phage BcepF1]